MVTQGELKVKIRPGLVEDPGGNYKMMCEVLQRERHQAAGAPKPTLPGDPGQSFTEEVTLELGV